MSEYIEREAVLRRIEEMRVKENDYAPDVAQAIYDFVVDVDAADVAPVVHSYWEHKITNDGENIGICHNCKYPVSWFWEQAKYCLNCGAKMDGGDGDDDETD